MTAICVMACHAETKSPGSGEEKPGEPAANPVVAAPIVIDVTARRSRPPNWSVQYWSWLPSEGDPVEGTQELVQSLKPALMRVGGYNSDANQPAPFHKADLDKAIAYAQAIGAQPLLQVPLIGNVDGKLPSAEEAADIVKYANVSRRYGVKYFAIGNEPDLYATQGSLVDPSQPAFVDYTPHDYCVAVAGYASAMKAIDPTIQIVGPQLAYKYQENNDWLTPILQECGDQFDIVSIQRFPLTSAQATINNAAVDAAALRRVIGSIRGILSATGHANKPLAITGMNIAYDATALRPGANNNAAPGTLGSALWLADITGTAQELDLWTTVYWDISDSDSSPFGLIGPPPAHKPRPSYYAYQLYAEHFGPTLLEVKQLPSGVSAYATRNQADDSTNVIVVNWNAAAVAVGFELRGAAKPSSPPIIELPALSMAAVEIPDSGAVSAWVYGPEQARVGKGTQRLKPVAGQIKNEIVDWPKLAVPGCVARSIVDPRITVAGKSSESGPSFASATEVWGSFSYAGEGQPVPTMNLTAAGDGFALSGKLVEPLTNNYQGVGLYFNSPYCADASSYTGVEFKVMGDLEGCQLSFGASSAEHVSTVNDPPRGHCSAEQQCYGPRADLTDQLKVLAAEGGASGIEQGVNRASAVSIQVPFSSLQGGSPVSALDPSTLSNVQWQLQGSSGACQAKLTITAVAFY